MAALILSIFLTPFANMSRDTLIGIDSAEDQGIQTLVRMLNRLNYGDYLLLTLSREPKRECADRYLTWPHYLKNTVNFLAPGDPYAEARLSSSNAFGICYRHVTEETMPRYHSEVWTLPGLAKIMYPGHAFEICALLGLILGAISRALRALSGAYGAIIYAFWVLWSPFSLFFTMGVDHTINNFIVAGLRLMIALAFIAFVVRYALGWRSSSRADIAQG